MPQCPRVWRKHLTRVQIFIPVHHLWCQWWLLNPECFGWKPGVESYDLLFQIVVCEWCILVAVDCNWCINASLCIHDIILFLNLFCLCVYFFFEFCWKAYTVGLMQFQVHGAWLPPWFANHLISCQVNLWVIMVFAIQSPFSKSLIILTCSPSWRCTGTSMGNPLWIHWLKR